MHSLLFPIVPNREADSKYTDLHETIVYLGTCSGSELAKIVAPEAHHLFTNWDNLPLEQRGEHLAHCIGKYGTDFLLPIAAAKGAKVVGSALKEAAVIGKLEGVIAAGTQETRALGVAQGPSTLVQGTIALEATSGTKTVIGAAEEISVLEQNKGFFGKKGFELKFPKYQNSVRQC